MPSKPLDLSAYVAIMPAMFTRELNKIKNSAFLLGPRGTGKSTWIRDNYRDNTVVYDLLNTSELIRLSRDPSLLYKETSHLPPGSWVIVDEIQKVPALLNEVHRLKVSSPSS